MIPAGEVDVAARLAVAALAGLGVGIERQWSGAVGGKEPRFAGARTFFLFGLVGGLAGWLATAGLPGVSIALLAAAGLLVLVAYFGSVRTGGVSGATTETAALAVLAIGTVAGLGHLAVAGGVTAALVLLLGEKQRINAFVERIGPHELEAGLQFAVLALVILPLLPPEPLLAGVSPRALWLVVLLFSALNFAGYLAQRAVGEARGYPLTGLLGGLVSSTVVTLSFARRSRRAEGESRPLALGIVAACTMLMPRVLVITAALSAPTALALGPMLLVPLLVGAALTAWGFRRRGPDAGARDGEPVRNPLRLGSAIKMVLVFQAVLLVLEWVRSRFAESAVLLTAAALGLTNMDALTLSMSRAAGGGMGVDLAAQAILVGILTNTALKLAMVLGLGDAGLRRWAAPGLLLLGLATLAGLWVGPRLDGPIERLVALLR